MRIHHSLGANKSLDFDDCGHLCFCLVILQHFVLSWYGMFKATVHQVLGISAVMESVRMVGSSCLSLDQGVCLQPVTLSLKLVSQSTCKPAVCFGSVGVCSMAVCVRRIVECCGENAVASYG